MLLLKSLPSFLQLHILLVLLPFDGSFPCSLSPATPKYRDHSRMGLCHFPSATSRILQASSFILRVIMPSVPTVGLVVKSLLANAGDTRDEGLIPGLGRSPGEGHSNSLECPCLENPMDSRAWWATVHRVAKSQTRLKQLNTRTHTHLHLMAFYSSKSPLIDPWTSQYLKPICSVVSKGFLFHVFIFLLCFLYLPTTYPTPLQPRLKHHHLLSESSLPSLLQQMDQRKQTLELQSSG